MPKKASADRLFFYRGIVTTGGMDGSLAVVLADVNCVGNEDSIEDCSPTSTSTCSASSSNGFQTAHLYCSTRGLYKFVICSKSHI